MDTDHTRIGFELASDTIKYLYAPHDDKFSENHQHNYDKPCIFLRDLDIEPLILDGEHHFFTQA